MRELHGVSSRIAEGNRRVSSVPGGTESDGLIMPEDWLFTRMPCPASTPETSEGLICPTSTPVSSNILLPAIQAEVTRMIILSDDEYESETSLRVQGESDTLDIAEVSSHSSDRYYTSDLDSAIREVIEEEDSALVASGSD